MEWRSPLPTNFPLLFFQFTQFIFHEYIGLRRRIKWFILSSGCMHNITIVYDFYTGKQRDSGLENGAHESNGKMYGKLWMCAAALRRWTRTHTSMRAYVSNAFERVENIWMECVCEGNDREKNEEQMKERWWLTETERERENLLQHNEYNITEMPCATRYGWKWMCYFGFVNKTES